jgi:hypothetical protein
LCAIFPTIPSSNIPDTTSLAISAAVAIADAPFAELEYQSRELATLAACGMLAKQDAVDVAYCAALGAFGPGMVQRHGADTIQEIIAAGFEMQEPISIAKRAYATPESVEQAFWYVVSLDDEERLARWLHSHPDDAEYLTKLLEAKCQTKSS